MLFLGTIKTWWRNRQRDLYEYWDGERFRRADPLQVGSLLERECPDYSKLLEVLYKDPSVPPAGPVRDDLLKQQREAATTLAAAARKVFKLPELTDSVGLTEAEAFRVLTGYFQLMEGFAAEAAVFMSSPAAE